MYGRLLLQFLRVMNILISVPLATSANGTSLSDEDESNLVKRNNIIQIREYQFERKIIKRNRSIEIV